MSRSPLLTLLTTVALFLAPGVADAQRVCRTGKPCGNTCIARDKVCRVGTGTARAAGQPAPTPAAAAAAAPEGAAYVASSRGRVYYWTGCSAWRSLAPANLRYFNTAAEAQAAGYTPSQSQGCAGPPDSAAAGEAAPVAPAPEEVSPPAPPSKVRVGMTKDEVRKSAGPPDRELSYNWYYGTAIVAFDAYYRVNGVTDRFDVLAGEPLPATREMASSSCTVSRIIDGDTLDCADGRRIRLLLIDAPEMDQGPFGEIAKRALESLAPVGATLAVEPDVELQDRYGRFLGHLFTQERRSVNQALLDMGVAIVSVYPPNVNHVEAYRAAQEAARHAGRELWAVNAFECSPSDFRAGRCGAR